MNKTCVECNVEKPLTEFYKDANTPGGHRHNCKECKNKKTMLWRNANREHYNKLAREHHAKHYQRFRLNRYGITPEEHNKKRLEQNNLCGGCNKPNTSVKRDFATDHDHETGSFRAILCYDCNRKMGLLDDLILLVKLLELKENTSPGFFEKLISNVIKKKI